MAQIASAMRQHSSRARELFLRWDAQQTGSLSPAEFLRGIASLGLALSADEQRRLLTRFDVDGSGTVDYDEFVTVFEFATRAPAMSASHTTHSLASSRPSRAAAPGGGGALEVPAELATARLATLVRRKLKTWKRTLTQLFLALERCPGAGAAPSGSVSTTQVAHALNAHHELGVSAADVRAVFGGAQYLSVAALGAFLQQRNRRAGGSGEADAAAVPYPQQQQQHERGAFAAPQRGHLPLPPQQHGGAPLQQQQQQQQQQRQYRDADNILRAVADTMNSHGWKFSSVFERFDTDGDGVVDEHELGEGLAELGVGVTPAVAARLMRQFDTNGDGVLQKYEFLRMLHVVDKATSAHAEGEGAALAAVQRAISPEMTSVIAGLSSFIYDGGRKARAVFRRLDATGNKKVGLAEFIDGLQEMGIEVGAEDAEALLARFDDDGDGQISMSGFMRLLAAQPDARLQ
jgi:Ca2+-binding EF-hand superfamily protein